MIDVDSAEPLLGRSPTDQTCYSSHLAKVSRSVPLLSFLLGLQLFNIAKKEEHNN